MWKYKWWPLPALLLSMGLGAYWFECETHDNCNCKKDAAITTNVTPQAANLSISDSAWKLDIPDDFKFKSNGDQPHIPDVVMRNIDNFATHIKEVGASKKTIEVTGYYKSTETNNTKFKNLGEARAEAIKQLLVQRGIPEGNIFTVGIVKDDLAYDANDSTYGAVSFNVGNVGGAMSEAALFEPRKIYFETGKNQMVVTDELRAYFAQAKTYLSTHPNDKLQIVGHTDNKGDSLKNEALSKNRSIFVQGELGKQGLPATQTVTDGKGQAQPFADNATEDGRKLNRRVEVTLIKGGATQ
jgi:OmpA-OmpF porin, OOP family